MRHYQSAQRWKRKAKPILILHEFTLSDAHILDGLGGKRNSEIVIHTIGIDAEMVREVAKRERLGKRKELFHFLILIQSEEDINNGIPTLDRFDTRMHERSEHRGILGEKSHFDALGWIG
jgi:hypothetical protein